MRSSSGRLWVWVGLIALVVINVVLVALLVLRPAVPAGSEPEGQATELSPSTTTSRSSKAPVEPLDPTEGPNDELSAGPAERILVNADDEVAWRAIIGDCSTPGELQHTVDGGKSWDDIAIDLAPLVRLRVLGAQSLFAIGGGAECEAQYLSSATAGATWSVEDQYLVGSWYLDPANRDQMATPVGVMDTPCEAVDLVGTDATDAAVLCTHGELAITRDGGATWDGTTPFLDALAIGVADEGYALAGVHDACEDETATTLVDLDGEALDDDLSCAPARVEDDSELAITAATAAMWLWYGEDVIVSTDDGGSW